MRIIQYHAHRYLPAPTRRPSYGRRLVAAVLLAALIVAVILLTH